MSQAENDSTSNIIAFPARERPITDDRPATDREIRIAILEDHLANMRKAALLLAYSVERSSVMLSDLKAMEGMDPRIDDYTGETFGDIALFDSCDLAIVPKTPKRKRP